LAVPSSLQRGFALLPRPVHMPDRDQQILLGHRWFIRLQVFMAWLNGGASFPFGVHVVKLRDVRPWVHAKTHWGLA
jgi:hypothetical protein